MVARKQHTYKQDELDLVHRYLLCKAAKRNRKLELIQQDVARELGYEKTRMHRMIAQMVEEGRLRVLGDHRRYTTVIVAELD